MRPRAHGTFTAARVRSSCKGHPFYTAIIRRFQSNYKGDEMRTRITMLALITVAISLIAASAASSQTTYKLNAALNIGQETTRVKGAKAGAAGRFTATLNGTTLTWRLTFRNLSGSATAAHIHTAPKRVAGPVTVPLCAPCTSPVNGTSTLTADQVKNLLAGKQYVNVHTAKNPGGEIRGQITKAPTK
jgi:CHRD domain